MEQHRQLQACQVVSMVTNTRIRQPRIGTRKLHYLLKHPLQCAGIKVGRDGLFDIFRNAGMLVRARRAYHETTDSHHRFRKYSNLLKPGPDQVIPVGFEQVWVADITYIPTGNYYAPEFGDGCLLAQDRGLSRAQSANPRT